MTVLLCRFFKGHACALALLMVALNVFAARPLAAQTSHGRDRVFPGEYIVTFPHANTAARTTRAMARRGVAGAKRLARGVFLLDTVTSGGATSRSSARFSVAADPRDTFCRDLLASGDVVSCSPNYEVRTDATATTPNDPMFSSLWGLHDENGVGAERAWKVSTGSADVVVAVIDTGIDYTHPDLRNNIWTNPDEVPDNGIDDDANGYVDDVHGINAVRYAADPGDPMDDNGHGTHVAGTIGGVGNNGQGVVGVTQNVKIVALKFLGASGAGALSDAIVAIDYMIELKNRGVNIRVANNSWGGSGYAAALAEAIERAEQAGIIFVAAAGNEGSDNDAQPSYPASFESANVVSVAALDELGNMAAFSNYGATSVDIAAPGVGIYSTYPGNLYARLSGTSMATPHVVGALALLFAAEPELSYAEAIARLYQSGRDRSSLYDGGRREALVHTRRSVDVGRMLFKETKPVPEGAAPETACTYDLRASNLALAGVLDTSADRQPIVQRSDEGEFYRLELPFPFPFYEMTLSTLYVSPNGVVYVNPPSGIDFETGRYAPIRSIAAFHIDMIPLSPRHGLRVFKGKERVTIQWEEGVFVAQKADAAVKVRLTLYATGQIESSVSFEEGDGLNSLRRLTLGDPFQEPPSPPAALIGISGPSISASSVLDISTTQKGLVSSLDQQLVLGVSMTPRCKGASRATVSSITLKRGASAHSNGAMKVRGEIVGQGSGDIPVSVAVDSFQCEGFKMVRLQDGQAKFRAQVTRGPGRVVVSSGAARGSLKLSSEQTGGRRVRERRASVRECRTFLRSLRGVPSA